MLQKIKHRLAYVSVHNQTKCTGRKRSMQLLHRKNYLEQQILKISVQLDKSFSKYPILKGKINLF